MSVHEQDHYLSYANEAESNSNSNPVSGRVGFADVKAATLRSLDYIVPMLLPGGKREGDEWVVRNPTRNDNKPGILLYQHEDRCLVRLRYWRDWWRYDRFVHLHQRRHEHRGEGCSRRHAERAGRRKVDDGAPAEAQAPCHRGTGCSRVAPAVFPPRTEPDDKGKPSFTIAGEDGPKPRNDEIRRHVYRQGGVPVRIKVIKVIKKEGDSRAFNLYRVTEFLREDRLAVRKAERLPADPVRREFGSGQRQDRSRHFLGRG